MASIAYFQGDLLKGKFSLRSNDACTAGKQNPYIIPALSVVKMIFPGTVSSVTIDSDTAVAPEFGGGNEITIDSYTDGDCSFTLIPTKGALVKLSVPPTKPVAQPINIVVLDSLGAQIQTFEIAAGIVCTARSNA
jgi:hypothetical protein